MVTNGFAYEGIGVVLPTLLVLGTNGVTVTSGEAPSAQKGTDFGNVPRGLAATNTLSFTNNGASLLTIRFLQISHSCVISSPLFIRNCVS